MAMKPVEPTSNSLQPHMHVVGMPGGPNLAPDQGYDDFFDKQGTQPMVKDTDCDEQPRESGVTFCGDNRNQCNHFEVYRRNEMGGIELLRCAKCDFTIRLTPDRLLPPDQPVPPVRAEMDLVRYLLLKVVTRVEYDTAEKPSIDPDFLDYVSVVVNDNLDCKVAIGQKHLDGLYTLGAKIVDTETLGFYAECPSTWVKRPQPTE